MNESKRNIPEAIGAVIGFLVGLFGMLLLFAFIAEKTGFGKPTGRTWPLTAIMIVVAMLLSKAGAGLGKKVGRPR